MAEIVLFHHAYGLTAGVRALGTRLEQAGHTVHLPDLYDGEVFGALDDGLAYAQKIGFGVIQERGVRFADDLPAGLVYAGISLGVMSAQQLAQTRPGARGALLFEGCLPPGEFGDGWPASVPVQIHGMESDEIFAGEGDLDAAREVVAAAPDAELFLYPGARHIFADESLPGYDEAAAILMEKRVLDFLARISR